jgi:DNA-binding transcriptional ArsR family regulator
MAISSRSVRRAWVQLLRSACNMRRALAERLADEARMRRDMVFPWVCSERLSRSSKSTRPPAFAEPLLCTPGARQARPVSLEPNDRYAAVRLALMPMCGSAPRLVTYLDRYVTNLVRSVFMEAALRALADPSRRTVLERLSRGPVTAGELAALLPIARPGVSRHLRVLREAGLVEVRQDAQRRVYSLRPEPLAEIDEWLDRYRALWEQRLDALHTEIARGKRERRSSR